MNDLEHQIKQLIIDSLALEDITPAVRRRRLGAGFG